MPSDTMKPVLRRKKPNIKDYFHRSPTKHSFRSLIPSIASEINPQSAKLKSFGLQNNKIEEEGKKGLDYDIFDLLKTRYESKSNFLEERGSGEKKDTFEALGSNVGQVGELSKILGISKLKIVCQGDIGKLKKSLDRVGTYNFHGTSGGKRNNKIAVLQALTSGYRQMLIERGNTMEWIRNLGFF